MKDIHAGKLDPRAQVGRFIRYDAESKGYRIYWPRKRSITVERNVVFNENDTHTVENFTVIPGDASTEGEKDEIDKVIQHPTNNAEHVEEFAESENQAQNDDQTTQKPEETHQNTIIFPNKPKDDNPNETEPQAYIQGQCSRPAPGTYRTMNNGLVATLAQENKPDDNLLPPDFALIRPMNSEPKSLDKALRSPDADKWQEALEYEISQLERLDTWVVEDLPKGQVAISCSKVLKIKRGPDGKIQRYHVRIVAGGHRQIEGVNYMETFLVAAKMPTVHVVLANVAELNWEIEHVDVKSAYLNTPLKETVYMRAPHGVLKKGEEGKVLRLVKGLYGLKQAGQGWYLEMMRVFVENLEFKRSKADHSVFFQKQGEEHTVVAVATNDMAITSKRGIDIQKFKSEIKNIGKSPIMDQ